MSATKKKYLHSHAANSRHFCLFLASDVNVRILTDAQAVDALCQLLDVLPITKQQLKEAVRLRPYDYEDAVQYLSALPYNPDVIITRDKKGFNDFDILVMTPAEFVNKAKE